MNKCICDVCRKNEANHKFKVKRHMLVDYITGKWGYRKIDICDSCHNKLMRISVDKKIEDEISELILADHWYKRYNDAYMQSAYLDGFQAVLDMLIQNKILKM